MHSFDIRIQLLEVGGAGFLTISIAPSFSHSLPVEI